MSSDVTSINDSDPLMPSSQPTIASVLLPPESKPAVVSAVENLQGKEVNPSLNQPNWKSIGPVDVESLSFDPYLPLLNQWSESLAQSSLLSSAETLQVTSTLSDASLILVSEPEIIDACPNSEIPLAALMAAQAAEKLELEVSLPSASFIPTTLLEPAPAFLQFDKDPRISAPVITSSSLPTGPQGAWKKPLSLSASPSTKAIAFQNSEVSPLENWPALCASKQSSKRLSKQASGISPCLAKTSVPEISLAEEESLKDASKEYPWAAKMDQSLRNLHRVTNPEYMDDGTPLINIPNHVLLEGLENQKEFVVGQFYRCKAPSGGLVHAVVNRIWGRNCRIFTRKVGESSYLFHIPNESTRKWIMQRGLWHVDDCLMFVSAWTPAANITLPEITTIPAWLTLKNIPNQLYSIKGIKWIASGIGEPMLTSRPWLDPTQMGETKILVEVKLDKPFPQRVALKEKSGKITMVDVVYSWLPSKCIKCGHLGHKETRCLGIGVENAIVAAAAPTHSVSNDFTTAPSITNDMSIVSGSVSVSESDLTIKEFEQVVVVPETSQVLADCIDSQAGEKIVESSDHVSTRIDDFVHTTSQKVVRSLQKTDIAMTDAQHSVQSTLHSGTTNTSGSEASRALKGKCSSTNKFAVLDWGSEMEEPEDSDDDIITDLSTPFTDRLLRDRPVKPSTKASEMAATLHSTRGRGNRGRGRRGGHGRLG